MRPAFALRLALREGRHGLRRVGVYMGSITLGVAALVSIHSFRSDVARSVQAQADVLLGADVRLSANRPFPDSVSRVVDSLSESGVDVSRVTTVMSMVLAPSSGDVRLLQVRAVQGGFPFYGKMKTTPVGAWAALRAGKTVLVDPAVLTQLRTHVGDSLAIGHAHLRIAGTVEDAPTDLGYETAIGPRVYVTRSDLDRAGLLGFGSLARYAIYLRMPDASARQALSARYDVAFRAADVRITFAKEQADRLARSVRFLGRFLGLVGLAALLLGGIGVGSAIHVYIRERRPGVAILRCLGADQWTVFLAYVVQAATLGFVGSALGVVTGLVLQRVLPVALSAALPVPVHPRFSPLAAAAGLGVGLWVALIFALIPLLQVRDVPPLQALRQDFEASRHRWDVARVMAWGALAASVAVLCVMEAPDRRMGLGFAGGLAVTIGVLGAAAWGLARLTRRFFPTWATYPVRQGVSNLFRPQNQTLAVTLALGFGAFVVGTILEVQSNLLEDLTVTVSRSRPNVLLFDVQKAQKDSVLRLLPASARADAQTSPIVPGRIVSVNGRSVTELQGDTAGGRRPRGWALRRIYRNTYRAHLGPAETLLSGRWWDGTPGTRDGRQVDAHGLVRVSLEEGIARDLHVGLGDRITWNVSGVDIRSIVTSIRSVDWARLQPNFFAVFQPGSLDDAPQTFVVLARIPDAAERATLQRALVRRFPNVSALDFSRVRAAIDAVLGRVRQAVTFLGLFSGLAGVLVLLGALATSRVQRVREGALLRTLGARRRQVLVVLLSEYLALGTLATTSGLVLAWVAAAVVVPRAFGLRFTTHLGLLGLVWLLVTGVTVAVGLLGSRGLLRRTPLAVLREVPE